MGGNIEDREEFVGMCTSMFVFRDGREKIDIEKKRGKRWRLTKIDNFSIKSLYSLVELGWASFFFFSLLRMFGSHWHLVESISMLGKWCGRKFVRWTYEKSFQSLVIWVFLCKKGLELANHILIHCRVIHNLWFLPIKNSQFMVLVFSLFWSHECFLVHLRSYFLDGTSTMPGRGEIGFVRWLFWFI